MPDKKDYQLRQLALALTAERQRSAQLIQYIQQNMQQRQHQPEQRENNSSLGAYQQLWGKEARKSNRNSYDGSAFRTMWG